MLSTWVRKPGFSSWLYRTLCGKGLGLEFLLRGLAKAPSSFAGWDSSPSVSAHVPWQSSVEFVPCLRISLVGIEDNSMWRRILTVWFYFSHSGCWSSGPLLFKNPHIGLRKWCVGIIGPLTTVNWIVFSLEGSQIFWVVWCVSTFIPIFIALWSGSIVCTFLILGFQVLFVV